jgi:hypothetical protein
MDRQRTANGPIDRPVPISGVASPLRWAVECLTGLRLAGKRLAAGVLSVGAAWCQAFRGDAR